MSNLETRFTFDDDRVLAVRCMYVDKGFAGALADELLLDFDCYVERRAELEGIENILRDFRQVAYKAFRWALGDLINHFEPA